MLRADALGNSSDEMLMLHAEWCMTQMQGCHSLSSALSEGDAMHAGANACDVDATVDFAGDVCRV